MDLRAGSRVLTDTPAKIPLDLPVGAARTRPPIGCPLLPAQPDAWTAAIFVDELNLHPVRNFLKTNHRHFIQRVRGGSQSGVAYVPAWQIPHAADTAVWPASRRGRVEEACLRFPNNPKTHARRRA
jgi:hypothetical protein